MQRIWSGLERDRGLPAGSPICGGCYGAKRGPEACVLGERNRTGTEMAVSSRGRKKRKFAFGPEFTYTLHAECTPLLSLLSFGEPELFRRKTATLVQHMTELRFLFLKHTTGCTLPCPPAADED